MFADHHFNRRHQLRNVEPVFRVFVALKFPTQIDGFVLARKVKETGPFAIRQLLDRNLVIRHIFYSLLWRFRRETMRAGNRALREPRPRLSNKLAIRRDGAGGRAVLSFARRVFAARIGADIGLFLISKPTAWAEIGRGIADLERGRSRHIQAT